jgi:hypothetical protein
MKSKRKIRNRLILVVFFCGMSLLDACKSTSSVPPVQAEDTQQKGEVSLSGTLEKQGITTYQYGTHVLHDKDGKTFYALKSETLQLDTYIGKTVELKGTLVNDYPVDGGPQYIEVVKIKVESLK